MNPQKLLVIAIQSIWQNKSRSFLTTLGVIIGVWAVSSLVAVGNGLQNLVAQQFEEFGVNNIFIAPGDVLSEDGGSFGSEDQMLSLANNSLQIKHVNAVRRLREYVKGVSSLSLNSGTVTYRETSKKTSVAGVDASYGWITNTTAQFGDFFTDEDVDKRTTVAVLGSKIAADLFGDVDPIGKRISINNQQYVVVGLVEEKGGGFGGPNLDSYIYIPISTWFKLFDSQKVFRIIAAAKSEDRIQETIGVIEDELLKDLKDDEFSVFEQTEILDVINQILSGLTAGLGGIAAISLIVGGVGIMNIMLVSVTERTREIGLRKAIGATPNVIMAQFLVEAVILSLIGGLVGIFLALLTTIAIKPFIPASLSMFGVLLAFSVSVLVGVVFGVVPARKAAKLSPIQALRYE